MVLEQNVSAMSEHNTQSAGSNGQPDLAIAHSKKMSLANKMKKQRKIRQSGAGSPIPNESASVGSKSPVRTSSSGESGNSGRDSNSSQSQSQQRAPTAATSNGGGGGADPSASNNNNDGKTAGGSGSVGSSLLHNKRRAMQLAKTRRSQDQNRERSPVKPKAKATPATAPSPVAAPVKPNDMSASRVGLTEPAFHKNSKSPMKPKTKAEEQDPSFSDQDISPVPSVESSAYKQYNDNVRPKQTQKQTQKQVQPTVKAVVAQRSFSPVPPAVPRKELPTLAFPHKETKGTRGDIPQKQSEEVVPWETEESDMVVQQSSSDDTEADCNYSQAGVSVISNGGRSVISNGVVDYDESIMSLARLDNFRSKSNQSKANKQVVYPGSSGIPKSTNSNNGADSMSSSDRLPSQVWKSPNGKAPTRASPVRASSWRERPTHEQPKAHGQSGPAPWMKSPVKTNTEQQKVPASPAPSTGSFSNAQPTSPARSSISAAPRFERPGSPFLAAAPKFSSSRSDVGVEPMPLPKAKRGSGAAGKSWRPPSATKKTVVSSAQDDVRAPSPTPSCASEQLTCPASPTQSLTSEAESEAGKSLSGGVPKAKVWSSKKPTPSWLKRGNSLNNIQSPPPASSSKLGNSLSNIQSPPPASSSKLSESKEVMEPKPVMAKAKNFSSPLPSIPKPVSSSNRKVHAAINPADDQPTSRSPRRHSFSTSPSWAKPAVNETEDAEPQSETTPPVATAKTWSAKKQTPSWMKKANGADEPAEKPPAGVPTTKVWSAKKQTPAWMKQDNENEPAPTPSPLRMSTPSWMKPGQTNTPGQHGQTGPTPSKDAVVSVSPQTSVGGKAPETPPSPARSAAKTWRTSTPSVGEQKPTPSPRSQSWKPRSQPSPDRVAAGTKKIRHSISGGSPKVVAAHVVKNQRSPSPSVAQLQEQIFVTKLGISNDSNEGKRVTKPPPSSPSPQVKQLQQIIFSPEKKKVTEQVPSASPAAGWWKRVPNAPQVRAESSEAQGWKHEGSSASVGDEQEQMEVSPSPTMNSENPPTKKSWKRPSTATNVGAPSWLTDVAEFHSNSPKPKLPSPPPVWQPNEETQQQPHMEQPQQPEMQQTDRPSLPTSPQTSDGRAKTTQTSKTNRNLVDEGSSDLMVVSSTSTTSRNDVEVQVQQEDIKSLIQMAADSVLIADYEQAMQRVVVDSKSDDEEDSVGNGVGNSIPNDLPLEFQRALTAEDKAVKMDELAAVATREEHNAAEDEHGNHQEGKETQDEQGQKEDDVAPNTLSGPIVAQRSSQDRDQDVTADQGQTRAAMQTQPSPAENESSGTVVHAPPARSDSGKSKPNIADRAKALLGWPERRVAPPKYEEMQDDADEADPRTARQERDERNLANETHLASIQQDENGFPCVPAQDENGFPCIQDEAGFPDENGFPRVVQDENGFPCAPLAEESIPTTFADAFAQQQWVNESSDEKKESSELLQYWSPEMDALNDSTGEWASRDPGLDSVPMASPEPINAENVILTAEKVLRQVEGRMAPSESTREQEQSTAISSSMDGWVDHSRSSRSKENVPSTHVTEADIWDLKHQHEQRHAHKEYSNTPERHLRQHFPEEAGWTSPNRTPSPNPPRHEPVAMADPMWGSEQAIDATWGSPQPDPFSPATGHFDEVVPSKRQQGDVFDPFGEEEDNLGFPPFSEPPDEFVAVASFSPPAFAPKHGQHQATAHADVFDTYYNPNSGGYPDHVKPVSGEMESDLQYI